MKITTAAATAIRQPNPPATIDSAIDAAIDAAIVPNVHVQHHPVRRQWVGTCDKDVPNKSSLYIDDDLL